MRIGGNCHCGNIRFELAWPADADAIAARVCNCSFCVRHAAVWTAHPQAGLTVYVAERALISAYTFATNTAVFQVCARCGVVPLVTSDIAQHRYAVVNVNALTDIDRSRITRSDASYDSEDTDSRLARRQRHWIARVAFADECTLQTGADP